MQSLLSNNIDKIKALCITHNVKNLFAFGSVCTDQFNDKSDIDLLVSFNPMDYGDYADSYFELAEKFEKLFKRQVDLMTDKSLKNPYFIGYSTLYIVTLLTMKLIENFPVSQSITVMLILGVFFSLAAYITSKSSSVLFENKPAQ